MNAQNLATLSLRHASRLRIAAVALALASLLASACAHSVGSTAPAGPPRCADLVAHALASPNVAVPGAYACMAPKLQEGANQLGITDDATFAAFAATDPVFTGYEYKYKKVDSTDHRLYYYFEFTPNIHCARFSVNTDGLVDGGEWNHGGECPKK